MSTEAWSHSWKLVPLMLFFAGCRWVLPISEFTSEPCGNGALDPEETCDPGSTGPVAGCSADCRMVDGWNCEGAPSICEPICGDDRLVGDEDCEGDPGEATCQSTGHGAGTLTCSTECRFDYSQCMYFDAVACGADHTCVIHSSGSIACWGGNASGQVGDGTTSERLSPVFLDNLSRVTAIAVGEEMTCAVSDMSHGNENLVYCWGDNSAGGLGVGETLPAESRTPVVLPWFEELIPEEARVLGSLGGHLCAAISDGTVACWGLNDAGQVGDGQAGTDAFEPVVVDGLPEAVSVSGGVAHTCAVLAGEGDGTSNLRCWGENASGQLGDGTNDDRMDPVAVEGLFESVSCGGAFTCGVTTGHRVTCWGDNDDGQLGDGTGVDTNSPVEISLPADAVQLACGLAHACALLSTGEIACWGRNWDGQLGDGTHSERRAPIVIPALSGATSIATGHAHTCATLDDGAVLCWGSNASGQLGDGTHLHGTPTPQPVIFN